MGKKKQIRNLESEVERLRKNVIDREVAIDKLLSDTITDQEKNVIKLDRQFDKMVQKEFDRNIIVGKMPDYSKVSEVINAGTFTPTNKQKADVEAHRDKINFIPDKNIIVGLTATPIRNKNVEKLVNNLNLYNKETNIVDNPNFSEGFNDLPNDEVNVFHRPINHPDNIQTQGRQYRHTEEGFVLIQAPVGSFIVPPTNNPTITYHLAVIQEELQKEMDEYSDYDFARGGSIQDRIRDAEKIGDSIRSNYVEFKINHGDKFHKEVEYDGHNGTIKTKITYPNADGAPKTMADIHDDINLMETIVKMPGCNLSDKEEIERLRKENEEFRLNAKKSIDLSFQQLKGHIAEKYEMKSCIFSISQDNENLRMEVERLNKLIDRAQKAEKRDEMNLEMGHNFINEVIQETNHLKAQEQNSRISKMVNDFTANELKDVESYNEKYIFLSDYHISSPYLNEDIVIKTGAVISLLVPEIYGVPGNSLVKFSYENIKLMEEKGLVRRLSPLEICGEPQQCAPAKED